MENSEAKQKSPSQTAANITVALSIATFLIGGELLVVGSENAAESYSSGVAFIVAIALLSAAANAASAIFGSREADSKNGILRRVTVAVFGILAAAAAVFVTVDTASDFSSFAADVMLLRAPKLPVALLFLAFCVFLAFKGGKTVIKFAFLSAVTVGACALLLMLLSFPSLDLGGIEPQTASIDVEYTVAALIGKFAPVCVALVYFALECGAKKRPKISRRDAERSPVDTDLNLKNSAARLTPGMAAIGILTGGIILALCHFNVSLLLGSALPEHESFPYSAAIGAVSTGKLFMRVEGISYAMYFFSMSARASIAIGTLISLSKRFMPLKNP